MKTIDEVIAKFPQDVQKMFDFSNAKYVGALKPITGIVCPRHGGFQQYAAQLRKRGALCPKCGAEQRNAAITEPVERFLQRAEAAHPGLYTYEKTQYTKMRNYIIVTCRQHGDFKIQAAKLVLARQGCPTCGAKKRGRHTGNKNTGALAAATSIKKHAGKFVEKAQAVHGNKYDYSESVYTGARNKISIRCPEHGYFRVGAWDHINKTCGCPTCSHHQSTGEAQVAAFLSMFTPTSLRNRQIIKPKELDIYLPEHKLAVEYCGEYWHSMGSKEEEKANKNRHLEKHLAASDAGVELITLYATEWENRKFQVKRLLRARLGKLRGRVFARKCELREVPTPEARAFYDKYHIQGGAGYGVHYGLYWKDKLVACMRFTNGGNDRGAAAKNRTWTLSRYATRVGVIGGASRLFKAFVRTHSPDTVKSFSDTRLFSGAMYEKLGFTLKATLPPDYVVWSPKLGIRPKPHYQRRYLQKRLEEHGVKDMFDPDTDPRTEAEITYSMGAKRLFDCGKKRWVWEV